MEEEEEENGVGEMEIVGKDEDVNEWDLIPGRPRRRGHEVYTRPSPFHSTPATSTDHTTSTTTVPTIVMMPSVDDFLTAGGRGSSTGGGSSSSSSSNSRCYSSSRTISGDDVSFMPSPSLLPPPVPAPFTSPPARCRAAQASSKENPFATTLAKEAMKETLRRRSSSNLEMDPVPPPVPSESLEKPSKESVVPVNHNTINTTTKEAILCDVR